MSNYAIGIGGTGAKFVEALAYLSAAGMIPGSELCCMFVDPDKSNGSLGRAQLLLEQYVSCESQLALGTIDLLRTKVVRPNPDVWSPFEDDARPCLDSFFKYRDLQQDDPAAANLFDVLFSPKEKETNVDMGFRGHPAIGAAVLGKSVNLSEAEPWQTLRNQMAVDAGSGAGARIFLCGSIFGGTGAAGFPTIARLIHNEKEKTTGGDRIQIGGALVLPYFSFVPGSAEDNDELRASSENFLMNTQVALKYYHQKSNTEVFDAVYLFGDESMSPEEFSIGGKPQKNRPHFIELYAAMAAVDFFSGGTEKENRYFMLARHQKDHLGWNDLPDGNGGSTVRDKVEQLARFAFAYLSVYFPALEDIRGSKGGHRAPWFVSFFEREGIDIREDSTRGTLESVRDLCQSFLKWLGDIQTSAEDETIELINHNAFSGSNFRPEHFDNLTLRGGGNPHALDKLWERMCDARVREPEVSGIGKFLHALYRECAV